MECTPTVVAGVILKEYRSSGLPPSAGNPLPALSEFSPIQALFFFLKLLREKSAFFSFYDRYFRSYTLLNPLSNINILYFFPQDAPPLPHSIDLRFVKPFVKWINETTFENTYE